MLILPRQTATIVLLAIVVYLFPSFSSWMVYDRNAIMGGELLRLFTGNFVHFSLSHLIYDIAAIGICGWIIEFRHKYCLTLYLLSATLIGLTVFFAAPEITFYGGLSGVATGALIYVALNGFKEAGIWRLICIAALIFTALKITTEIWSGHMIMTSINDEPFIPVPLSHLAGGITGLSVFCWANYHKKEKNRIQKKPRIRGCVFIEGTYD